MSLEVLDTLAYKVDSGLQCHYWIPTNLHILRYHFIYLELHGKKWLVL